MKLLKNTLIIAFVLAALIGAKFKFFPGGKQVKTPAEKGAGKKPSAPVTVYVVGSSAIQDKLYATGTVLAKEQAELRPEVSGRITYLHLPEGSSVEKGTLLLKINDSDLRAQLEKIKSQLKLASEIEARQRRLLKLEGISQIEYDNALGSVNALKADSAYNQALLSKTEIRAPFSGIIGIRNVSLGSYVSPAIIVSTIQQISTVKIDFSLPEKYTALLKEGDLIKFNTEGLTQTFTGRVTVRDPQVDVASRSVRYRAESVNFKGQLLPGAFARVEIPLKQNKNTLFVPTEAIVAVLKGKKVFTVKEGVAEEKLVETGIRTEEFVQVLSGLEVGDSVVVNGNFALKKGAPVKVAKNKSK